MATLTFGSSSATSSTNNNPYHVFINHRGPDVKKTFASHLYRGLLSHGLRAFLDQQELQVGENLTSQIEDAIKTASVHVAIFSPSYAESKWCLDELLLMLESKATIIPVFYHVKPSDLRWTRGEGVYAKALHSLEKKKTYNSETNEEKPRYDSTIIEKWRNALSGIADTSGLDLQGTCNGDEGELVEKIVQLVFKRVKKPGLHVAKYPTGLDEKVEDFENKVLKKQQCVTVQVVGIVGMGGAGKTTLAKELFNRKSSNYGKSYFLNDVRESKRSLHSLQSKLLKGLTQMDLSVDSVDAGIEILKDHLSSFHSKLIILDDVDSVDQVDALFPDQTVLCSGSLVLITSRNKDVLTSARVQESSIYHLTGLNPEHSRQLFCLHAFSQPHPQPEFEYMVDMFLKACDGLPLSLKVFGALFYGQTDIEYWEQQLDRLQHLPSEIQEKLKISYEALNKEEKKIFIDIACFFIGENKDMAIRVWDASEWKGLMGFRNLKNRCLVDVDRENKIQMHDHLRDLGREIAEEESTSQLCLWTPTQNIDDLLQQTSAEVIAEVRGMRLRPSEYNDDDEDASFSCCDCGKLQRLNAGKLQIVDIEDDLLERILRRVHFPNLVWLRWKECPCSSLPSWIPTKNLTVLEVDGNNLETLWETQVPLQLRELMITAPLSKFPKSIGKLKHLQRIHVYLTDEDNVKTFPEEICNLRSLTTLELLRCSKMKSLPESFGNLKNLQHISLSGSRSLERLPNSFRNLIRLKYLDLSDCINLTISMGTFRNITTLECINLRSCEKMEVLPPQIAHQRSLEKLCLNGTNLKELPDAIGKLQDLEVLELGSPLLETLPLSLGELRNLQQLALSGCRKLKYLPDSILQLNQLTEMTVTGCVKLCDLPFKRVEGEREALKELEGQRTLSNFDSSIEKCMFSLQRLKLYNTGGLSEVSFQEGVCPNLQHLDICGCHDMVEIGKLPNTLLTVELTDCFNLREIKGLCGLEKLQSVHITRCSELKLPNIETLVSLEKLVANGCMKLKSIRGLEQLTKLRKLECSDLEELLGVEHLRSLNELWTYNCVKPKSIRWLEELTQLRILHLNMCHDLEELPSVEHLRSLEKLEAPMCKKLKTIGGLEHLEKLRQLSVVHCSDLEELPGVENCASLEILYANGCPKLQWGLGVLEQLGQQLERLVI